MKPLNAVNLTWQVSAYSDDDLRAKIAELLTQVDLYGVRSFVDSSLGIVEVVRRDVTPEQYRNEVHQAAEAIRANRGN